ncbi:MAG: tetratricopeptide repeat protein [Desulfovibrionales bacterium]
MEGKIKFFEEALAADPRSTLFYSLAKLHVGQGDSEKAIDVLRRGLDVHPDHLRANCMLVSLLLEAGDEELALAELDRVTAVLEEVPDLWAAWAEKLNGSGKEDAALAAFFLASFFKGDQVSWAGLIEQGMRQLIPGKTQKKSLEPEVTGEEPEADEPSSSDQDASQPPLEQAADLPGEGVEEIHPDDAEASLTQEGSVSEGEQQGEELSPDDLEPPATPSPVQGAEAEGDVQAQAEDEGQEEPGEATIRTKTMADILVEQGDYSQAMEIYQEILEDSSVDESRRQEIEDAVNALRSTLSDSREKKLLRTLEKLAQRLENRASSGA